MPPYQMNNPVNDFYFRNAQSQMTPQFQQFQQQYQFPPVPQQAQMPVIHASWVTNIEEAKASQMKDFISANIYLDAGTGKIYLKNLGNDGRPQFVTYTIEKDTNGINDPLFEINSRLTNIENALGGLKNESVSVNASVQQSEPDAQPDIAGQNEPDGSAESAGIPKVAGNDFWKKRK